MAVAFDAVSSANGTGTSLSWLHTCSGADRAIKVDVAIDAPVDFNPSVTYAGVALTPLAEITSIGQYLATFRLVAPTIGENTVSVTGLPGGGGEIAIATSLTGVDPANPNDAPVTATIVADGGGNTLNTDVTSEAGDLVVDGFAVNAATTATAGGSQTIPAGGTVERADSAASVSYQAGATTTTMTWTAFTQRASQIAVNFNAAGGGGGGFQAAWARGSNVILGVRTS